MGNFEVSYKLCVPRHTIISMTLPIGGIMEMIVGRKEKCWNYHRNPKFNFLTLLEQCDGLYVLFHIIHLRYSSHPRLRGYQ